MDDICFIIRGWLDAYSIISYYTFMIIEIRNSISVYPSTKGKLGNTDTERNCKLIYVYSFYIQIVISPNQRLDVLEKAKM